MLVVFVVLSLRFDLFGVVCTQPDTVYNVEVSGNNVVPLT